ncbi:MAG: YdcF family protein, partial [Gammaproteobacteria bacterium]|nr:YdcF family protein [Gammaproteobacteria bacterium]
ILVTGGLVLDEEGESLAQTMAESLTDDFAAGEIWLEDKSRTTAENALFSKKLLSRKQVDSVFLVTQAWHMPRAVAIFEKAGLNVIPAPTAFKSGQPFKLSGLLPAAGSLQTTRFALHEILGLLWYKIRY